MLMFVPLNFSHRAASGEAAGAALGAASALAAAEGGEDVASLEAAGGSLGDGDVVAGLQPAKIRIRPMAGAIVLDRDTGFLLLTALPFVQHTERPAVG